MLKNNSDKEWLQYNCGGGVIIDIKANSVFEVEDSKAVALILKNLGADAWVTVTKEIIKMPTVKVIDKVRKIVSSKKRLEDTLDEINKK